MLFSRKRVENFSRDSSASSQTPFAKTKQKTQWIIGVWKTLNLFQNCFGSRLKNVIQLTPLYMITFGKAKLDNKKQVITVINDTLWVSYCIG
jgi:hypothetical protein